MNKQEVIKKAYGEYWGTYKDIIDDNGWFSNRFTGNDIPNSQLDFKTEKDDKQRPFRFRIKGLKGIENNNGWIKIESEADLPKDLVECYVYDEDGDITYFTFNFSPNSDYLFIKEQGITHYKPITKPLKPIY